jgi:diguanylate cyclase (GGDEF)-like protein
MHASVTPALSPLSLSGEEALALYRCRAEFMVGLVQLGLVTLFGILYFSAPMTFERFQTFAPVPFALALYFGLTGLRLWCSRRRALPPPALYASIALDFGVLYGLIWSFHLQYHQPAAFYLKAPTLLYVFIFIALRALRLEARYVITAGGAAALGWGGLVLYALLSAPVLPITHDFVAYINGNALVLIGAEIDKIIAILVVTGVLALAVSRGKHILLDQITTNLDNARLLLQSEQLNANLAAEVDQRRAAQEELHQTAYYDRLTTLPNRAHFLEKLERMVAGGEHAGLGVILIDIDRFAAINDTLGHEAGDRILTAMAERLRSLADRHGLAARFWADAFAVAFPAGTDVERDGAAMHAALSQPYVIDGQPFTVTLSAGIAIATSACQAADVISNADIALNKARSGGRGRIVLFAPNQRKQIALHIGLEEDLRRAIRERVLTLHYQPIVRLADGQVAGYEALMRWPHPERGMVSPAAFIPIAEETGQIIQLGAWALQTAAEAQRMLCAAAGRPLFMSVNVSARQFADSDLLTQAVRHALSISPGGLKLEVTESLVIEDVERATKLLDALNALGASLSVDDFGTGHSSLSQLDRLPFQTLKIDRSFIAGLDEGRSTRVVEAIMALAHGLHMDVVAEGVETEAQRLILSRLGCAYGQGWLFGRPVEAERCASLLQATPLAS